MIATRTGLGTSSGSDVRSREVRDPEGKSCRGTGTVEYAGFSTTRRPWEVSDLERVDRGILKWTVGPWEVAWRRRGNPGGTAVELSNGWSQGSGLELEGRCHKETTAGKK